MSHETSAAVSALIAELSALNGESPVLQDEESRKRAVQIVRKLAVSLEQPQTVPLNSMLPVQSTVARIAVDLDLFSLLADGEGPKSIAALSAKTDADPGLLGRILRILDCMGWVEQVDDDSFRPTAISEAVRTRKPVLAGMKHLYDLALPVFSVLPEYFRKHGYQPPRDDKDGPFQYAWKTDLSAFDWLAQNPVYAENFNTYMTGTPKGGRSHWVNWFPVRQYILEAPGQDGDGGNEDAGVLMVDVGGGRGHDLGTFIERFPDARGRFVLEDLPAVVEDYQDANQRIEPVKHDFFDPQPIKSARIYHLHHVLHNWSDDAAVKILSQTASAMEQGRSRVFIVENCLPARNCAMWRAEMDWWMLALHNGSQRTVEQFRTLCDRAGLELVRYWAPPGVSEGDGVLEAVLKTADTMG